MEEKERRILAETAAVNTRYLSSGYFVDALIGSSR